MFPLLSTSVLPCLCAISFLLNYLPIVVVFLALLLQLLNIFEYVIFIDFLSSFMIFNMHIVRYALFTLLFPVKCQDFSTAVASRIALFGFVLFKKFHDMRIDRV